MNNFTETAARLYDFFDAANSETPKIVLVFPNGTAKYRFEIAVKHELRSHMMEFEGKPFDLSNFKFNGISWELLTK